MGLKIPLTLRLLSTLENETTEYSYSPGAYIRSDTLYSSFTPPEKVSRFLGWENQWIEAPVVILRKYARRNGYFRYQVEHACQQKGG
jgi:hypothetical protein